MNIELKNIIYEPELSRISNYIETDLYIDSYRAAGVRDNGMGGAYLFTPYSPKGTELLEAAKNYCLNHQEVLMQRYLIEPLDKDPITLDDLISDLVDRHITKQLLTEHQLEMERHMSGNLIYGEPGKLLYHRVMLPGPLTGLLTRKRGIAMLQEKVRERILPRLKDGDKILNSNISANALRLIGIPEKHIDPSIVKPEKRQRKSNSQPALKASKGKSR